MLSCTVEKDSAWQRLRHTVKAHRSSVHVLHTVRVYATPAAAALLPQVSPGLALCLWLPSELAEA